MALFVTLPGCMQGEECQLKLQACLRQHYNAARDLYFGVREQVLQMIHYQMVPAKMKICKQDLLIATAHLLFPRLA